MMIVAWDETRMRLYIFNEQERKKKKKREVFATILVKNIIWIYDWDLFYRIYKNVF